MSSFEYSNTSLKQLLKEILEDIEGLTPKPCNYGFYKEKKAHSFLKPRDKYHSNAPLWKLKDTRPLKIVEVFNNEVIFILTSTKLSSDFGCENDYKYGFEQKVPKIDFSKCNPLFEKCKWIKPAKSSILRRPHRGLCLIWSLSKKVFESFASVCGKCEENAISDPSLKDWILEEVNRYKGILAKRKNRRRKR